MCSRGRSSRGGAGAKAVRLCGDEKLYVLAGGVDDPYGCDIEVYRECAKKINGALPELYEKIKSGS